MTHGKNIFFEEMSSVCSKLYISFIWKTYEDHRNKKQLNSNKIWMPFGKWVVTNKKNAGMLSFDDKKCLINLLIGDAEHFEFVYASICIWWRNTQTKKKTFDRHPILQAVSMQSIRMPWNNQMQASIKCRNKSYIEHFSELETDDEC